MEKKLPEKKYKTIYCDPPWKYKGVWGTGSKKSCFAEKYNIPYPLPYRYMEISAIHSFKVPAIADDNCELYVWVTQKYLPKIFDIIDSWGFKYCQTLVWCKTPGGLGQGGLYTPTTEFLILARKGKMPKRKRIDTTWWNIKRTNKHSKKPDFFRKLIEQVTDEPRIELFARERYLGWDAWGDEV